jgi:hypothetical protein
VQTNTFTGSTGETASVTYTTFDAYNGSGQLYWTQDAVGTGTETLFDALGRATEVLVGVNVSPQTYADPSWIYLTETKSEQYDNNGVGDGDLTETTQYTNSPATQSTIRTGPNRITYDYYNWQDELVAVNNGMQFTVSTLDNLGEVTESQVYNATQCPNVVNFTSGSPQPPLPATALRAQTVNDYDNQGRVYETDVYSVDPNSGTVGNYLATYYYHDGRGDVVATQAPGGLVTTASFGQNSLGQFQGIHD